MIENQHETIIRDFQDLIMNESYPCVAARSAMSHKHIRCLVADHIGCAKDDADILQFLYRFIVEFRATHTNFHSAAVIFKGPEKITEEIFDTFLWQRLQSLSQLDALNFPYDPRVNADPSAPDFSFSLGEEAFFVIGLHPSSTRDSRRFKYPTIVFNPHIQFEVMRQSDRYQKMKAIVRKRDILYSGSINPMLADFGEKSEVYQYSGREYDRDWACPLRITHGETKSNSTER
jgi:uncharacterized protein